MSSQNTQSGTQSGTQSATQNGRKPLRRTRNGRVPHTSIQARGESFIKRDDSSKPFQVAEKPEVVPVRVSVDGKRVKTRWERVRDSLRAYGDRTTAHGFHHFYQALEEYNEDPSKLLVLVKLCSWVIITLICCIFMTVEAKDLIHIYADYRAVDLPVFYNDVGRFYPGLTVCNSNASLGNLSGIGINCTYNNKECIKTDINLPIYGKCYMYNVPQLRSMDRSKSLWSQILESNSLAFGDTTDQNAGMHLDYYTNKSISGTAKTASRLALRVVIHNQTEMPFPFEAGFDSPMGFMTTIALKVLREVVRIGRERGTFYEASADDCIISDGVDHTDKDLYQRDYGFDYSASTCWRTCAQKLMVGQCKCQRPGWISEKAGVKDCDLTNDAICGHNVTEQLFTDTTLCYCAQKCTFTEYSQEINSFPLRPDVYKKKSNDKEFGKIVVYFKDFEYSVVSDLIVKTFFLFLSDLGGIFSLYLGMSALTIFEAVFFLLEFIIVLL